MANLKKFDSAATSIRTVEDECDFVSFVVTEPDVPIQRLRTTIDAMAGTITRQIERRKGVIKGSFISFESIPAPCDGKGSERIDMEHVHAHCLLAVPKGQAGSRRMEVFEGYRDHKVITAGSAISGAYYNCKTSVLGWFTDNWQASLEHNFVPRAIQLAGFHRYRMTGIFRDRELPADQQKSLEELEAELLATTSTNEQENHPCVPLSTQNQSLDNNSPTDSPSSAKLDVTVKVVFKSKSPVIAAGSSEPDGIAFAVAKRVAVGAPDS